MEKKLNSSGIFSQDFRHCRFFRKSRMIYENGTLNLRNSQPGSSSCQCSTTSIGQEKETMEFVFRIEKKSRNSRKDVELFLKHLKENGTTAAQMVERFKHTGHPVDKSISALSRVILKKKNNRATRHFNADASNTELLFRIIHSVNQLSICGAVSNWCEQFGLTEGEKGTRTTSWKERIRDQRCIDKCEITLVSSPRLVSETVCGKRYRTSNHCPRQFDSQGYAKTQFSCIGLQLV